MTGKPSFDSNDWTSLWANAQQQYWQSWLDMAQKANPALSPKPQASPFNPWGQAFDLWGGLKPQAPPSNPWGQTFDLWGGLKPQELPSNPWSQAFDFWSGMMSNSAPAESRDWVKKLVGVNKGYLQLGETLWKSLSTLQGSPQSPEAWTEAVQRGLRQMQEGFSAGPGAGKDPWAAFATFWGLPMDTWQRVTSACSMMPGELEKIFRGMNAAEGPGGVLNQMLSTPTLGYTRESQEEVQRWSRLWLEYGTAMRDFADNVLAKITQRAGDLLGSKLAELGQQGKTPDTLRAFYDLWVDCGELAYAETAATPEFNGAQARLLNTLMAVKKQEQKMMDELLGTLNLPTRRELNTSHQKLHQLRQQVWRLQEKLDESGIRELREEIVALRREVETLRTGEEIPKPHSKRPAARDPKTNA
ncbi:MAG: class III poly(R)-hydroxyalkanoic acid synthase subunit PhaE [Pseudomonadota bacterium]